MPVQPAKDSIDLGIIVGDIEASLRFYRDLLGLEFVGITPLAFGTMHRLRFGTSDVKLVDPKTPAPRGTLGLDKQQGFRYLTFVVRNLTALCAELKGKGIEFTVDEREIRPGVKIAMVKDPDGNIVEFVQLG